VKRIGGIEATASPMRQLGASFSYRTGFQKPPPQFRDILIGDCEDFYQ